MSFETPNPAEAPFDRSEEAMIAARELIEENELLRDNPRVKALEENNFLTEDGRELDPGNFLAAMIDFIGAQETGAVSREDIAEAVERNMVLHSRPSELEQRGEDIDHMREAA